MEVFELMPNRDYSKLTLPELRIIVQQLNDEIASIRVLWEKEMQKERQDADERHEENYKKFDRIEERFDSHEKKVNDIFGKHEEKIDFKFNKFDDRIASMEKIIYKALGSFLIAGTALNLIGQYAISKIH